MNAFQARKGFALTLALIVLNVIVYVYTAILSGNFVEISYQVLKRYGQFNQHVLSGDYWQLFTAVFVHVDIVHLLGNMFFFLIFGLRAEELFKPTEYILVYFLSGLAGNLLTLLFGPSMVSAGASGAIFGIFGACAIYLRRAFGQPILGALFYAFFLLMISAGQGVNNLAHLGGVVVGLLLGYLIAGARGQKPSIGTVALSRLVDSYGRSKTSTLTLCPSLRFRCFLKNTGAITSTTDES